MSLNVTDPNADVCQAMVESIESSIEGAKAQASGGGGHFTLVVEAAAFEGKNSLAKQRMVLKAIGHLMKGDNAPVHAIDKIETKVPDAS